MNEKEKEIVLKIYEAIVPFAFTSIALSKIYRLYPEAFYKDSKEKPNGTKN
jgi:hypothetical protein